MARCHALEIERLRSKQISNLPTPDDYRTNQELNKLIDKKPCKLVTMHEANIFASTRYHMPDTYVKKNLSEETVEKKQNACQDALIEHQKQEELKNQLEKSKQERLEKARLRGIHAIDKQLLNEVWTPIFPLKFILFYIKIIRKLNLS